MWVVVVALAFVLFACVGGCVVVSCVGGSVFWALTHSVGHADVDEVVPSVRCADDIHNGFPWLPVVCVVEFWDVLLSVACVSHIGKPSVQDVA